MRYKGFLIVLLMSISLSDDGSEMVWKGVYAFYNYDNDSAVRILTLARHDYPENPAVHLTWAASRWLHSQATASLEDSYQVLQGDLDEIIPVYKSLTEKYPDDPQYALFYGSAKGLRARVHLGKKEWISTLISAYSGFTIIKDVAEENPDMLDAQLPIGLVEYYAGISSVIVKWAVTLFGLETEKSTGLEKIEKAASMGDWSWIEASSICSFLHLYIESKPNTSLEYSTRLHKDFPHNFYFQTLYVEGLIKTGQLEKARCQLDYMYTELDSLTAIQHNWYYAFWCYEEALLSFANGDVTRAQSLVDECINTYHAELDIILTNAWLLKGKLHDLQMERQQAVTAYINCIDRDNYTSAIDSAKSYLNKPFTN